MNTHQKHQLVFYSATVLLASLIGTIELPEIYFSNKYNPINQYMAKYAWGWTLTIIVPLILNRRATKSIIIGTALLAISTLYFVISVKFMDFVNHHTGSCNLDLQDLVTKTDCKQAGGNWNGFDISGHCFLLVHSSLYINHELGIAESSQHNGEIIGWVLVAAKTILAIWWTMLIFTCFYFHSVAEALLGLWVAVGFWAIMYKYGRALLAQ